MDRVISQASNQDQCLLYKLANYKKGGELIDAYNIGGTVEVEKLIREQFGQLTYQDGHGQIINRSEKLYNFIVGIFGFVSGIRIIYILTMLQKLLLICYLLEQKY